MNKLKLCKCGCEAEIRRGITYDRRMIYIVQCTDTVHCGKSDVEYWTEKAAISSWNRREGETE